MMAVACVVCNNNLSKYKCSTCFSPYCSVNCWKIHKSEDSCKIAVRTHGVDNDVNKVNKKKYFTEDTVSEEKLNQLGKVHFMIMPGDSQKLKNILSNRYLQSTLIAVDNATNPEEALKQAMKDPEFVEFVDECLKIVEDSND